MRVGVNSESGSESGSECVRVNVSECECKNKCENGWKFECESECV